MLFFANQFLKCDRRPTHVWAKTEEDGKDRVFASFLQEDGCEKVYEGEPSHYGSYLHFPTWREANLPPEAKEVEEVLEIDSLKLSFIAWLKSQSHEWKYFLNSGLALGPVRGDEMNKSLKLYLRLVDVQLEAEMVSHAAAWAYLSEVKPLWSSRNTTEDRPLKDEVNKVLKRLDISQLPEAGKRRVGYLRSLESMAEVAVELTSPFGDCRVGVIRKMSEGSWYPFLKGNGGEKQFSPVYICPTVKKASESGIVIKAVPIYEGKEFWGIEVECVFPHTSSVYRWEIKVPARDEALFSLVRKADGRFSNPLGDVFRQGDVLFRRLEVSPGSETCWQKQLLQEMRILQSCKFSGYVEYAKENLIKIDGVCNISHPDHQTITLLVGVYRVVEVDGTTDYVPSDRGGD
jgi:hypothetical protein